MVDATMENVATVIPYPTAHRAHYSPPWADMNLVGIAGSSGSGKTSLAIEIIKTLDLPWVVLLSMVCWFLLNADEKSLRLTLLQDSFYKSLTPEQNALAHANEYDLDSPNSLDFDLLVEKLKELKQGFVVPKRLSDDRKKKSDSSRAASGLTSRSTPFRSINAKARPSPSTLPMLSY